MAARALDDLIALLAKLPGLGPRSARRAALHLIKQRETLLRRLAVALTDAADAGVKMLDLRQSGRGGPVLDLR